MSVEQALAVMNRINLNPVMVDMASVGMMEANMRALAEADVVKEQARITERQDTMLANLGLSRSGGEKPFAFSQGIAVIPIQGSLINRFGSSWGFVTGYNYIQSMTNAAQNDPDVKGIIYDVDSHGGEVAGAHETADVMRKVTKPTMSLVDSNSHSAGFLLGTAAQKMVVTPSGSVGSVGVVAAHMSYEGMLDKAGMKMTLIYSGAHKVDGNPYQDLTPEAKASIQAKVDQSRDKFAATVAEHRGLEKKAVLDTEAKTYRADDALGMGLIDQIATPSEAIQTFISELSGSKRTEEPNMSTQEPGANADGKPVDVAAIRKAERERASAITTCEEAKGKGTLANHLAFNTDMSVDDCKALLKAAAPEASQQKADVNPLEAAMDQTGGGAKVGPDGKPLGQQAANQTDEEKAKAVADRIVANAMAAGVVSRPR